MDINSLVFFRLKFVTKRAHECMVMFLFIYGYVSFLFYFFLGNSAEMLIFRAFCGFNWSFGSILAIFLKKNLSVKTRFSNFVPIFEDQCNDIKVISI